MTGNTFFFLFFYYNNYYTSFLCVCNFQIMRYCFLINHLKLFIAVNRLDEMVSTHSFECSTNMLRASCMNCCLNALNIWILTCPVWHSLPVSVPFVPAVPVQEMFAHRHAHLTSLAIHYSRAAWLIFQICSPPLLTAFHLTLLLYFVKANWHHDIVSILTTSEVLLSA